MPLVREKEGWVGFPFGEKRGGKEKSLLKEYF